jgi:transposase
MLIIGCDFHSRFQQIAMLDTETGEWQERRVAHGNGQARQFYATLPSPALVGIESTGYALWFADLLAETGHELAVGHAAAIRAGVVRQQKTDRNDARHLLDLLRRGEFPRIWLPTVAARDVRVMLEHRHWLVQMRTRVKNALQALAMNYGLCQRRKLWSGPGREQLAALPLREGMARRRGDLLRLLGQLDGWIGELDQRLAREAAQRADAQRLMTHPGVGVLSALATTLILGPVERFAGRRQVASYAGLIPAEYSSGGRQQFGRLTKQGNPLLRFLLVEAAQSAARYDPELRRFFGRLTARKGVQKAQAATARKLLVRLYVMLRDGIDYAEFCRRGLHAGRPGGHVV